MKLLRNVTGGGHSKLVVSTLSATLGVEKFLPCHCDEVDTLSCQMEGKSVFTLSEVKGMFPLPLRERVRVRGKKAAFTLAEVLITLGVIGVVAAMTLPAVIANINERVNSERQANIAQKITQAMDQMRAHGLLNQSYASTDAFVDELQKYLKVAKRCSASNIADCWPTAKVTDANGEEFEVKDAKTGKNLNHKDNDTDNVGLVLADGASLIMTYNTKAEGLDIGDRVTAMKKELSVGGGKFKEFPYSTSVAGAVDFVMDVNGAKGPNSETVNGKYHDIRSFNGAQFAKGMVCDFMIGKMCVKNLETTYTCISEAPYTINNNCWAGAMKACSDIGMSLASIGDLNTIYAQKGKVEGVPTSGGFWSSAEDDSYGAWVKYFHSGGDDYSLKFYQRGALCVGN